MREKETVKFTACSIILTVILLCVLCSCGTPGKSEKEIVTDLKNSETLGKSETEIVADLKNSETFISPTAEIDNYEIEKRQTDENNRSDIIYITVHATDKQWNGTLSYIMEYELYNDGWILESVQRNYDGPWEISGLTDTQLIADVENSDYYFMEWDLTTESIEISNRGYNSNATTLYEADYSIDLTAHDTLFDYYASYDVFYEIVDGVWKLQNVDVLSRRYAPTFSPNISATDTIMGNLELGSGATATKYDSYEYLKSDADWRNCMETRYYVATKDWWFGTETYLISIPLTFSLENWEDGSIWRCNAEEIENSIQSVDWNLEGTWVNKYDSRSTSFAVIMTINNFSITDDPEKYTVNLACDASSSRYSYLCKTYGNVDAKIKYSEPGRWLLYIDDTIAEIEGGDRTWYVFELIGYSAGATHEGFSWEYSSLSGYTRCDLEKVA